MVSAPVFWIATYSCKLMAPVSHFENWLIHNGVSQSDSFYSHNLLWQNKQWYYKEILVADRSHEKCFSFYSCWTKRSVRQWQTCQNPWSVCATWCEPWGQYWIFPKLRFILTLFALPVTWTNLYCIFVGQQLSMAVMHTRLANTGFHRDITFFMFQLCTDMLFPVWLWLTRMF